MKAPFWQPYSVIGYTLFSPESEDGCVVWYDTRSVTIVGGVATVIANQVFGGGRDLSLVGGSPPIATDAGYNNELVISFDGSSYYDAPIIPTPDPTSQPFRIYMVAEMTDPGAHTTEVFFDCAPAGGNSILLTSFLSQYYLYTAGAPVLIDGTIPSATPLLLCIVVDSGTSSIYLDDPATPIISGSTFASGEFSTFRLGARSSTEDFLTGKWTALGVFEGAGDEAERTTMFDGLRTRYGL